VWREAQPVGQRARSSSVPAAKRAPRRHRKKRAAPSPEVRPSARLARGTRPHQEQPATLRAPHSVSVQLPNLRIPLVAPAHKSGLRQLVVKAAVPDQEHASSALRCFASSRASRGARGPARRRSSRRRIAKFTGVTQRSCREAPDAPRGFPPGHALDRPAPNLGQIFHRRPARARTPEAATIAAVSNARFSGEAIRRSNVSPVVPDEAGQRARLARARVR